MLLLPPTTRLTGVAPSGEHSVRSPPIKGMLVVPAFHNSLNCGTVLHTNYLFSIGYETP